MSAYVAASRLRADTPLGKKAQMCRWLAYCGSPILLEKALYSPAHSLIDQSLHSTLGAEATNGDGFGIGWYDDQPRPGVFRSIEPAWNDQNLRELAAHMTSGHVLRPHSGRDRIGRPADQLPPVPSRALAVHAQRVHRRARPRQARPGASGRRVAVPGDRRPGRHRDPVLPRADAWARGRSARRPGTRDRPGRGRRARKGIKYPFQGTMATTDGERMWAFRYSSEGRSRSLFFTTDVPTLRDLYPEREILPRSPTTPG